MGQILTYAAGTGARKVIWVAESFRPEHVAALEFLNQNTTDDLNFFAVEVELWRIGDSPLAPMFEVVAKPNEWAKTKPCWRKNPASSSNLALCWTGKNSPTPTPAALPPGGKTPPLEDEAQWPQYFDWFVQRIVKMNAVFRPVIQGWNDLKSK